MPFAVEVGDGEQVQRLAQALQPGGDLRGLRQHVAAGQLQVLHGIAAQRGGCRHRRDQLAVAGAHALRDLLPGGAAGQVDGHDVGAPLRQPGQRPGLAAGTQQHQVPVRQVEPFGMASRQVQRLRVGRLDHAGRGPGIDAPRQRVAAQAPALVGHLPARRCAVLRTAQAQRLQRGAGRRGHGLAQRQRLAVAQVDQLVPGRVEPGAARGHGGLRPGRLQFDQPAQVQRVGMAPVALGQAALGGAGIQHAQCRRQDAAAHRRGAALAAVVERELDAAGVAAGGGHR